MADDTSAAHGAHTATSSVSATTSTTSIAKAREQAIDWLVEARSGTMDDAQRQALAQWRAADPAHEAAWAHVSGALQQALQPLAAHADGAGDAQAAMGALMQPVPRRRQVVRGTLALAGLGVAGMSGLAVHRMTPLPGLLADARTATAERRVVDLADGSRLLLDARSAADVSLGAQSRRVFLRHGALIASVAADASRPFSVHTPHGSVGPVDAGVAGDGGGWRCMVRLLDAHTEVAALDQTWAVHTAEGQQGRLRAGQCAWLQAGGGITADAAAADDLAAWQHGMLAVRGGTLGDVVDSLRAYRRGFIRVSPAAARLRVLGAFALDDTDHTLQALADTLPITVTRYQGGWLTVIDRA